MAMSWYDNGHSLSVADLEYLNKVNWLWNQLSAMQRTKIESSVINDTLRQENSKHCVIGEAMRANRKSVVLYGNPLVCTILGFIKSIFYDGPSYDNLLEREITKEEKEILNDIYYAEIGNYQYHYRRANELVRSYIIGQLTV